MRRGRSWWTILLAVPLVLLAADTLYWWIAVRSLERGYATWEDVARGGAWSARHGPPVPGGWPLAATLILPELALSRGGPAAPESAAWSADRLTLRVELAWPRHLDVTVEGQQRLRLPGSAPVAYTADRFRLELPLHAGVWPDFIALAADNLRADVPNGGSAGVQTVRLRTDSSLAANPDAPAVTFALEADEIRLPAVLARPLGPRIERLVAEGVVNGPVPSGKTPAEQAAAWRDGGGSVEIRRLAIAWGALDLSGTATLALDEQLQPMGAGSARLVGYAETLDTLAAHGVISRSAATATKAVLSLLAHAPEDGSPPDVEVPLTLQYRTLSMRQVPLLRLPELDWP
jgi:hypothetical protein